MDIFHLCHSVVNLLNFLFVFLCPPQYLTELLALNKYTIKFIEEMWTILDQFWVQLLYT